MKILLSGYRRSLHRALLVPAASLMLLFSALAAHGQSIGDPISGAVSDPLYSESNQVGPSSSLLPNGASLTSPANRTGTSDPLGTLIETGSMSPYVSNAYPAESYANVTVNSQSLNDPVLARSFDEYRNNRALMTGTLATGSLLGRVSGAGGMVSGAFAGRSGSAGGAFGRGAVLAPFAAGSSAGARQQAGMLGFVDPNTLVGATTSGAAMAAMASQGTTSSTSSGATGATPGAGASGSSSPFGGSSAASTSTSMASGQGTTLGTQSGVASVPVFPVLALSAASNTGFEDSTMGTAGQPTLGDDSGPFHARVSGIDSDRASPFQDMSGQMTSFLHPSLLGAAPASSVRNTESVREYARRARLQAIVNNPGSQPPSPFEQRAMIKAYEAQHRRGGRSRSVSIAPSVVATP